jgi:hypothetical protein
VEFAAIIAVSVVLGNQAFASVRDPKLVEVKVAKVNLPPSPLKSQLLCEMTYSGFEGYVPFAHEQYQPLTQEDEATGFATSVGTRSYGR